MRNKEGEHRKREKEENIPGHNEERPEKEKGRKCGMERVGLRIKIGERGGHFWSTQNQENGSKVSQ